MKINTHPKKEKILPYFKSILKTIIKKRRGAGVNLVGFNGGMVGSFPNIYRILLGCPFFFLSSPFFYFPSFFFNFVLLIKKQYTFFAESTIFSPKHNFQPKPQL